MYIKSLLSKYHQLFATKHLESLHLRNCSISTMTSLENVISGWNDVKQKIKVVSQKRTQNLPEPRLVAVSKTKPIEHIIGIYQKGQRHFGENYVQELLTKSFDVEILKQCPDIKWHFIGHIQRNKVSKILSVPGLDIIETVDNEKLADAINVAWKKQNNKNPLKIMVQVNTSREEEKNGVLPDDVVKLCKYIIENCENLKFIGLMTIGRFGYDCSLGPNPDFLTLVECKNKVSFDLQLNSSNIELSMGMSDDFEHAIECGSTNVRVGSNIFGYRPKKERSQK
ncbi:pyridoxal phosphate homeostasis protein [Adelges cooleyi]|uniref:pyridoxal phosphate homeostasis protein n=1 Tax=Adelges cooleyi TaxID=133065 RepID=UPI0021806E00|nr:pyridoxal phosphate homeostasis protein [Adelges cooleyi]